MGWLQILMSHGSMSNDWFLWVSIKSVDTQHTQTLSVSVLSALNVSAERWSANTVANSCSLFQPYCWCSLLTLSRVAPLRFIVCSLHTFKAEVKRGNSTQRRRQRTPWIQPNWRTRLEWVVRASVSSCSTPPCCLVPHALSQSLMGHETAWVLLRKSSPLLSP